MQLESGLNNRSSSLNRALDFFVGQEAIYEVALSRCNANNFSPARSPIPACRTTRSTPRRSTLRRAVRATSQPAAAPRSSRSGPPPPGSTLSSAGGDVTPSQDPNAATQNGSAAGYDPPGLLVPAQNCNIDFVGGPAVDVGALMTAGDTAGAAAQAAEATAKPRRPHGIALNLDCGNPRLWNQSARTKQAKLHAN